MRIVLEAQTRRFKFSSALHVDPVETIHQDVGDGWIFEQRFQRAEAEDLVQNLP